MRHRILLSGALLTVIGLIGRYAIFTFVLDPNFMNMEAPPLPFYAFPVNVITVTLLFFSLPAAVVIEVALWRTRVNRCA
jgi:hypothetical protein